MKSFSIVIALTVCVFFIGCFMATACGNLSKKDANEAFLKEHPTYTIVFSDTGEGWEGVVNYHFDFKKPHDEKIYQEVMTFEKQGDGTWRITGRWNPKMDEKD
ncbi:MAG: hypothetical protein UZ17_ACD001002793 [Acidobacteria bacterium OLB17]|nr:MAG: hypothetical protein UZ17_ACD001002793 [Acidobacteria bacterium OLB17]MCZ2391151.1 hypothetical protein [Acidobacteriota bacterium]